MHRLLPLFLASILLLVACTTAPVAGSSPSGSPMNPYKAAYLRQANAVCQAAAARFAAVPTPGTDAKLRASALDQEEAIAQDELNSTQSIPVPREDAATLQKLLDTIAQVISLARSEAASLRVGDLEQATIWDTELQQTNASLSAMARAYGLSACG